MIFKQSPIPAWVNQKIKSKHLAFLGLMWILFIFMLPIVLLVPESLAFESNAPFQAYKRALNGIYVNTFIRSFYYGALTTISTLIIAYILSYYMSFLSKRVQVALALVVVPLWIAYIVRYIGILLFFAPAGPLAELAGVETDLLFSTTGVVLGLTNVYLPFAVLPIYNSLNSIDEEIIDASRVLGAGQLRTVRSVIFPLSLPGIIASGLIVFILSTGSFLGPAILGGADQTMIANLIAQAYLGNFNIQFASALAVIYTILLVGFIAVFNRYLNLNEVLGNV